MRYTNREVEYVSDDIIQSIRYYTMTFVFAPLRLIEAIAKKIIFLGEGVETLLMRQISILVILLISEVLYGFFISNRIAMWGGFLSVISFLGAMALIVCFYYLSVHFKFQTTLENISDKHQAMDDLEAYDTPHDNTYVDDEGTVIDDPDTYPGNMKVPDIEKPDPLHEFSIPSPRKNFPDDSKDSVYNYTKIQGDDVMLDKLKNTIRGRDIVSEKDFADALASCTGSSEYAPVLTIEEYDALSERIAQGTLDLTIQEEKRLGLDKDQPFSSTTEEDLEFFSDL